MYTDRSRVFKRRLALCGLALLALVVVWSGYAIYHLTTFHVVKTDPPLSSVPTVAPFVDVYFNRSLAKTRVSISSAPSITSSYSISGKVLKIGLVGVTNPDQSYNILIRSITSTAGKQLNDIHLNFTPKYVPANKLTTAQQNAIIERQAPDKASRITYTGTDVLISSGLSAGQVQAFDSDVGEFAQSSGIHLNSVAVDESSVTTGPLDGSGVFTLTFAVSINYLSYNAKISYSGIMGIELMLFNQSGAQIFDSSS